MGFDKSEDTSSGGADGDIGGFAISIGYILRTKATGNNNRNWEKTL